MRVQVDERREQEHLPPVDDAGPLCAPDLLGGGSLAEARDRPAFNDEVDRCVERARRIDRPDAGDDEELRRSSLHGSAA